MDKSLDHEIYYELCEQLTDDVTLARRRKILPTRMLKLFNQDSDITYQAIGTELLDSGQPQKSIPWLKKATIIDPINFFSQKALAEALFKLEKDDEAFSSIKKALSINPESSRLHGFLIEKLEEKHRLEDLESFSKEIIERISDLGPESVPAFYFKSAGVLLNCGKFPQALVTYRKAMKNNPPMTYGRHYDYGVALYYECFFEEALFHFEHARNLNPESSHALNNIAHLNYCLGRIQKAREEYEYIIENKLQTSLTYANFLLVLYHLEEDEEGIEKYKDSLEPYILANGSILSKLIKEQLKITEVLLEKGDLDEKMREFNQRKIESINLVLSFINEKINTSEENKTDSIDNNF